MRGDLEYPGSGASVRTPAPCTPEPTTGQLADGKPERGSIAAPTGGSGHVTCRLLVAHDEEVVADLQAYLKLFCRRRALIEIGDHGLAMHFVAADEAAIFSGLWTVWAAAGLVPTARCLHDLGLARLSSRAGWER